MATTMQPEIPWNVAGIAPEAREAARTSARREGLSVGEWLTRRILRGLPGQGAPAEEWWFAESTRTPSNENPVRNGHQRNIEGLPSVLPQAGESRLHSQNRSAPTKPAAQINARKDSDDAEQLEERIVRLDARIARIEIRAAAEEAKHLETIKALQAKLAELTEQISRTAARSAAHETQLAKAIEAVTEKFLRFEEDTHEQQSATNARLETIGESGGALEARIATLADDTGSIGEQFTEAREESVRQLRNLENRVAATEVAVEAVRHDSDELNRVGGSLDHLTQRFETAEAEYLDNVERFEGRLARVEADSGDAIIDRRLQSIEQALADMAKLIEKNTPEKSTTPEPANPTPDIAQPGDVQPHMPPLGAGTATPILDLPPFPEKPTSRFAPPLGSAAPAPTRDLRAGPPATPIFDDAAKRSITPEVDAVLSAARRNAPVEDPVETRNGSFSWIDPVREKQGAGATYTRLILLGGLGLLVVAAVGIGFYLSNTRGPGVVHAIGKPAGAIAQSSRSARPRATQMAASPASSARQVRVVASPNPAPVHRAANSHKPPIAVQKQPVLPAARLAASSGARLAKGLAPLRQIAALANSGHAKAQEVLGLAYLDGDGVAVNEAEGAKWLERAAARGEAVAAYRLGTLYQRGHGVAANPTKAAQWYAVAAKAGNRKAMHNLAVAYAQGSGVQKNTAIAVQWFSRAANLGLADSQFDLAVLYERGLGVPQSLAQAYKWYAIAAAEGDAESRARMEAIASQLGAGDKAAAEKSAAQFRSAPLDGAANAPPIAASLAGG